MSNRLKYEDAFRQGLSLDSKAEVSNLKFQDIDEWDSIGHMSLVSAIEEAFGIALETDDLVALESFVKGIEILRKYNVEIG